MERHRPSWVRLPAHPYAHQAPQTHAALDFACLVLVLVAIGLELAPPSFFRFLAGW